MVNRSEHRFSWWHQGVLLFDRDYAWSDDFVEYVEAASGQWLDQSTSRGVTYVSPGGAVFGSEAAPLTLEVHDREPTPDVYAESIGDFDLLAPSGVVVLEEAGGGGGRTEIPMPPGRWRARWSGFGEAALEARDAGDLLDKASRPDRYVIQLWPDTGPGCVIRLRGR